MLRRNRKNHLELPLRLWVITVDFVCVLSGSAHPSVAEGIVAAAKNDS